MQEIRKFSNSPSGMTDAELTQYLRENLGQAVDSLKKVLLLPPDFTRSHSGAGRITKILYFMLKDSCQVDIMPALGTHLPMSDHEIRSMFGSEIPLDRFVKHRWRQDIVTIGNVPGSYISQVSDGLLDFSMEVQVNKRLLDPSYDLILSIGQVIPHEVVGMANYNKNIFVGCGGPDMINKSHILGAVYGMERMMGRDNTPVRKVFDYAQEKYLSNIPLSYILTVTTQFDGNIVINGLFAGRSRKVFEQAVELSQEKNLTYVDKPINKVVAYLDRDKFKSTWLGNKAIYRTRMAIADGGELIILAPGVKQFGEDNEIDKVIRKYGYVGRDRVLNLYKTEEDLQANLSVTAHLIHGSSDNRFHITYATNYLTKDEVEGANYKYMPYSDAEAVYDPRQLSEGYNTLDNGETVYYITNPAMGLWALKDKFK